VRLTLFYITIIIGLTACKKHQILPGVYLADFIECNAAQNLDSTAISAKLIGTWTWKKQSIPSTNRFRHADKNIKVTFNSDSTFSVMENSTLLLQSTWKLVYYSANDYGLRTNEYSQYVGGEIYFCDNQLFFFASPVDGVDNLFER
jgi:hypothetical protein